MASGSVGAKIAAYRRRRGLSQAALAGLVGRSESWLSQVERGVRSVDRLSILLELAKVLQVDAEALTGRPWNLAPDGVVLVSDLDGVRQFFARYDRLVGVQPDRSAELAAVSAQSTAMHTAYQAARYRDVLVELPALLGSVDVLRRTNEPRRRDALLAYVSAYVVAAKVLRKLGASDVALVAADRCALAAADADSLVARGLAAYQVVCGLMRAHQSEDGEHLATAMAELLRRDARPDSPDLVSVAGSLWLIGAVIAARRTDRAEAWQRLRVAQELADMLGSDGNHAWTAFGPTNVAIHRVSVAAELGDAGEAYRAAQDVDPDRLPEGLKSRRVQVHLDLAWTYGQRRRDADAVLHLLDAEQIAPEALRYNVLARELVRELLTRQKRTKTSALSGLALRAGIEQ